jgi:diguanylate cyclase (GGDEF)-like protein
MLTPETIDVLLVALVAYALIIAIIVARRVRDGRHRRALERTVGLRPDPGDAWVPAAANLRELRHAPGDGEPDANATAPLVRSDRELGTAASWATWLDEETVRVARYRRPATIVLVDLTGLDRLAERIGPAAADRLIPPVVSTIERHARAADRLAQLGPTRFGVLLVETDEIQAIHYVERIRSACDLWLAAGAVAIRLSIGWAAIRADVPADVAVAEAERRLFAERRRAESDAAPSPSAPTGRTSVLQPTGT